MSTMSHLNSKFFTVLISVLSVWILFSVIAVETEKDETKREEKNIEAKIINIRRDNESLERFIENFDNPEFLDKEARLWLNYKAPGEEVVSVHRDINSKKVSSAESFNPDKLPSYKKWWHWLMEY